MADITMCAHEGCRQAMWCYRKHAVANEFQQAYADLFEPHPTDPTVPCLSFWALEGRRDIEPLQDNPHG